LQDSINIRWTGKGLYDSFTIQISAESDFTSVLHESSTNLSNFPFKDITNNTNYYWRVRSSLNSQSSQWSDVWSFGIVDPFITTVSPNGGEMWTRGETEVIRWETNVLDSVLIDLLQNGSYLLALDTLPGSHQAYEWEVPADMQPGENYSIQITSESNSDIFGVSDNTFTISAFHTGIEEFEKSFTPAYILDQNFPNPFYSSTTISYKLQESNIVSLKVYNLIGEEIHMLVNDFQEAGIYSVHFNASGFPGGVYFYKLKAGDEFVETKKMILY
jgi:hypothetical protein